MIFRTRMNKFNPCIMLTKQFCGVDISKEGIDKCFDFAYEMSMGEGHHRSHRTGGTHQRSSLEIFWDALRGKLAEYHVHEYFNNGDVSEVDWSIEGEGIWDEFDLKINDKIISVKSTKHFGNLLLLETKDYDADGKYIPSNQQYDYFMMVRVKMDVPCNISYGSWDKGKNALHDIISNIPIQAELTGILSNYDFVNQIMKYRYIIRKGQRLNNNTLIDADNYYVHVAELEPIDVLKK